MTAYKFKIGDRVYFNSPIENDQNQVERYERRLGKIIAIKDNHTLCDISSGEVQAMNVKVSELELADLQES